MDNRNEAMRDVPFFLVACVLHVAILIADPAVIWSSVAPKLPAPPIPIEFVTAVPKPVERPAAPAVTPAIGGGKAHARRGFGPGPLEREQVKAGTPIQPKVQPKKKARPSAAQLAARRARREAARRRVIALAEAKAQDDLRREEARRQALALKEQRAAEAAEVRRQKAAEAAERREALRQKREMERAAAAAIAAQKAEEARRRREEARQQALALAAYQAEQKRLKAQALAEARAAKARQKADLERQLASLPDPDEALSRAPAEAPLPPARGRRRAPVGEVATDPAAADVASAADALDSSGAAMDEGTASVGAGPAIGDGMRDAVAGPSHYGSAAAFEGGAGDPVYDADGRGGSDRRNAPARGGGRGDGGGVGWEIEGPVGSRRVLKRRLPKMPAWVAEKGLELVVQLKFQVMEDGGVKVGVVVQKTSGFPDVDQRAIDALRGWRFQPLPPSVGTAGPPVWGVVTFRFALG